MSKDHISRIVDHITTRLFPKEFTCDPFLCQEPKFDKEDIESLYYISLEGYESQYKQQPTFSELISWVTKNYEILCLSGHYIGYWVDKDIHYLDISITVYGKACALAIASANKQLCIYHPASQSSISVAKKLPKAS